VRLIHRRHFPVDHYVLVDEAGTVTGEQLIAEARRRAEGLAERSTGDRHGFTLIHNGAGIARRADPHVHIICARSRRWKGLVLLVIAIKNLLPFFDPARA
jgi:hypothetical protein